MFKKGRFLLHKVSGVGGGGVKLVTRFEGAVSKLMGSQVTDGDWRSQIPDPCEKNTSSPSLYISQGYYRDSQGVFWGRGSYGLNNPWLL